MRRFPISVMLILSLSCSTVKNLTICNTDAKVVDLSELDGCGLLLLLPSGEKLLPVNAESFKLIAGQSIKINYRSVDYMTTCMAEAEVVEITCLQPGKMEVCEEITGATDSVWLEALIHQSYLSIVEKYDYFGSYVYHCISKSIDQWYDCRGNLVCMDNGATCSLDKDNLKNKVEIWVAHR